MTRALVTQMLNALEHHQSQTRPIHKTEFAITAAREYLATEPSGERAELIHALKMTNLYYAHGKAIGLARLAADMLEADAQQAKSKDAELIATYAKLAEAELRANQLESQFKSQCRITASALDERAQQAKRVPMTPQEIRDWWASENKLEDCEMCKLHDFETVVRAVERRHKITPAEKPTDWSAA